MSAILVTGGTGTLGRALVPRLAAAGHRVTVLSRRPASTKPGGTKPASTKPGGTKPGGTKPGGTKPGGTKPGGTKPVSMEPAPADPEPGSPEPGGWATGDLRRGTGIAAAVTGAEVIVHCATSMTGEVAAARNLIAAARQAGGPHLVYISIVGVDRVPLGYYESKLATERLIADSGLPWTVLRATQFHNLILAMCAALARLPVMPLPAGFRFQPVEVGEVAERLAELAGGEPSGRVPDLGGPEIHPVAELAASYLRASSRRRKLLPVRLPGATAAAARRGGNLAPEHATGRVTFGEFLAHRFGAGASTGVAVDQAHPGTTDHAQPDTRDQAHPVPWDRAHPGTGDQAQPGTGDQAQPGTGDQAHPGAGGRR